MATNLDLGKMVGPLPLGAWVAVVGGGFAFMVYTRKQSDVVPADSNVLTPEDGSGISGVGDGSVGGWDTTSPPVTDTAPTTYATNEAWGVAAINWLIAQGYNPAVADSAIRKYLDQEKGYSAQEFALVTIALGHFGSPPTPLPAPIFGKPPIPVKPKPRPHPRVPPGSTHRVPRPRTPRSKFRYYTVRPGDTLSSISRRVYHRADEWRRIYNANNVGQRRADGTPGIIRNPNVIHPGWRLIIP